MTGDWRCIVHGRESFMCGNIGESNEGRMADALAHGGDEGRDKLR